MTLTGQQPVNFVQVPEQGLVAAVEDFAKVDLQVKHHTAEVPTLEVEVTMTAVEMLSVDEAHAVTKQVVVDAPVREHVAEMK